MPVSVLFSAFDNSAFLVHGSWVGTTATLRSTGVLVLENHIRFDKQQHISKSRQYCIPCGSVNITKYSEYQYSGTKSTDL